MAPAREPEAFEAEIVLLGTASPRSGYRLYGKRLLDLAIGIPAVLVFLPIVVFMAILVGVTSGWPAFYGAERIGRDGKPFRMWKLRTMVKDADRLPDQWRGDPERALIYFQSYKLRHDPRTTPLGRFLRKTSLDELPQLLNVLRGDMSFVGPRPIVARELENYGRSTPRFLSVRPGITGNWQITGRNAIDYPERALVELDYIDKISLGEDLRLLAGTIPALLRPNGI